MASSLYSAPLLLVRPLDMGEHVLLSVDVANVPSFMIFAACHTSTTISMSHKASYPLVCVPIT